MKFESEIRGEGWGDCHTWRQVKFQWNDIHLLSYSTWKCRGCFATFNHIYNYIPNIFKCMEACKVPNTCNRGNGRLANQKITGVPYDDRYYKPKPTKRIKE